MLIPSYATRPERFAYWVFVAFCALVFLFLVAPLLVIMPLSFSSEPWFTYPLPGLSLRWYQDLIVDDRWRLAIKNSAIVGVFSTMIAITLGTLAALGLSRGNVPYAGVM